MSLTATVPSALDALPAAVALLDASGVIRAVNEAWRRFADENGMRDPAYGVGQSYLEICERAQSEDPNVAARVLAGLRSLLQGETAEFSLEYPCPSPTAERWFRLLAKASGQEEEGTRSAVVLHIEVTERRLVEEKLRASEARLRSILDSEPECVKVVSVDGRLLEMNPAGLTMIEAENLAAVRGRPIELLVHSEDRAAYLELHRKAARGAAGRAEFRILGLGGTERWMESQSVPLYAANGTVEAVLSVARDITERVLAERHQGESERRYRELIDSMGEGLVVTDVDETIRLVNPRICAMLGYTEAELLGQIATDLLFQDEDRALMDERGVRRARGLAENYEIQVRRRSGELIWASFSATPIADDRGRYAGSLAIVADITAQRRATARVREERAFSEALLDSLPGIFTLIDEKGRLLRWNRAFETVSGFAAEEIARMNAADFILDSERALIAGRLNELFERGAAEGEATVKARNGAGSVHFLVAKRVVLNGELRGIVTGIDVTARKQLEEQLVQSQKIEAIGRLAGGVAHDFNNIVGVILGFGELAQAELDAASPVREHLTEMLKAANRAAVLTRQLQAFSRKQILQPRRIDLNELVVEAVKMLHRVIGEDIELIVRTEPDLGTVRADPGQIEQILMNLAVNARDAMPTGGTVTLETRNVDRSPSEAAEHPPMAPGRYVQLSLSDTGVGMDTETLSHVFEPFFTTKPAGQGTGLGLSTAYGIVKQSDGFIWAYSEPGHGTTFKIYLPRIEESADPATPLAPLEAEPVGDETILLVEDNPQLRETVRRRLQESGYRVLSAIDGDEALAVAGAHEERIDLLLTDVVMPKMGGGELARRLGAVSPGLRVLFMSGYTDGALAQHGMLEEGVALLEKPFSGSQLARAVRESLNRRSAD